MTATGYYAVGTTEVYTFLGFNSADATEVGLTDTMITDALKRAQREIQEKTKTHFVDTGTATPDWKSVTDEKHDGQGKYNRAYYTIRYPIPNLSTYTAGTISPKAGTVEVDSTNQYPSNGVVGIGANKVTYSSKGGTAFFGCSGMTGTVSPDTVVTPYVIEVSTDDQGDTPTWTVQTPDDKYDADLDTGRFQLYKDYVVTSIYTTTNPPNYTPNRVRISYLYGWSEIPQDVSRLTLMIACKDLLHTIVRRAYMRGMNNFNPSMINVDDDLIEETTKRYQNPMFGNI